jgi:hypothetical protein
MAAARNTSRLRRFPRRSAGSAKSLKRKRFRRDLKVPVRSPCYSMGGTESLALAVWLAHGNLVYFENSGP